MNKRFTQLANEARIGLFEDKSFGWSVIAGTDQHLSKFAELIVRECCLALWTEECHSSDLAFDEVKRNSKKIKEHFGIDPNEITEDMLARSIKWMEQQLADKKHFGVES